MGELEKLLASNGEEKIDPQDLEPRVDTPYDRRPDLSAIGIIEHERGVCEDTYENRAALRRAHLNWDPVYDQRGSATGLISARSQETTKERRLLSLAEKRPLLTDAKDNNSDYLTGLELLIDETASAIVPPWVLGATRVWREEQDNGGPKNPNRQPAGLPHRCRMIKSDGIRCMLWSSGRLKDDGLCRIHLKTIRKPGEDVERARRKLMQSAPYAVDVLEELMETAESEPVRLKASTEILDRAGVRAGMDVSVDVEVTDSRPPHVIVAERLQRLAQGAASVASRLEAENNVIDAEVVITTDEADDQARPELETSTDSEVIQHEEIEISVKPSSQVSSNTGQGEEN
mgnify:CR=1 FL=1